jgi:transcription antitermination factor NusG
MMKILPTSEKKWYLVYTNPRAEKKVAKSYEQLGFEYFLPLQRTIKQWSDRKKWVEEPLFKSYVFIKIDLEKSIYHVLSVAGASRFVQFNGRAAEVDEREINIVKKLLGNLSDLTILNSSTDYLEHEEGDAIEIVAGPLMGCEGKFLNKKGSQSVLIELKTMQQVVCVSMPLAYIRPKNNPKNKIA